MEGKQERRYALGVTLLFLGVGAFTAMHHEMWRDEIQAWLLARDSGSVFELFRHLKYEGHPGLWHLCLMPLTRITHAPGIMQIFHLLIAGGTVYLFARFAPFNRFQKFLLCFGYFVCYEYAILARNYALGLLLITVFCILFKDRYKRFVWVGGTLFLLAHTSVHALILTIAVGTALCCEYIYRYQLNTPPNAEAIENKRGVWIGFALIGIGIATSVLQLKPPPDTGFAVAWKFAYESEHLIKVIKLISHAFLPIPEFSLNFWNAHELETHGLYVALQVPLCCLLILCGALFLLKRPTALLIYLIAMFGLLVFFYIKYYGSMRHHGFLFITLLMTAWIHKDCPEIDLRINILNNVSERLFAPFFTLILICHFIGGITALTLEHRHVFSQAKETAAYIKANDMQDMEIIGEIDYAASTVVGYLERDQIYYVSGSRYGSFIRWDSSRVRDPSDAEMIQAARRLSAEKERDILILLNRALNSGFHERYGFVPIAEFTGSIVADESFYLYRMPVR